MKNILMLTMAGMLCLFSNLHAQKTIELDAFDAVLASGNLEVVLIPGDTERAVLEVRGAPQDELIVKTVRGELRINYLNALIYKNYEAKVTVWYKSLRSVRGNAGARIRSEATLTADRLELRSGSGAQVELDIETRSLEANASEGGTFACRGQDAVSGCPCHNRRPIRSFPVRLPRHLCAGFSRRTGRSHSAEKN
jgi:hypothetical protein